MLKKSDHVMMSPYRLPVAVADGLREIAQQRGCSMTHIVREAIVEWYARRGIVDPESAAAAVEVERREALKEEREKAALAAAEKAREDQTARDIAWLERWRLYSPGKLAPWPRDKPIPAGFESMIDRGEAEI